MEKKIMIILIVSVLLISIIGVYASNTTTQSSGAIGINPKPLPVQQPFTQEEQSAIQSSGLDNYDYTDYLVTSNGKEFTKRCLTKTTELTRNQTKMENKTMKVIQVPYNQTRTIRCFTTPNQDKDGNAISSDDINTNLDNMEQKVIQQEADRVIAQNNYVAPVVIETGTKSLNFIDGMLSIAKNILTSIKNSIGVKQ